ncbi:Gfo/Idh/MocA family protein [Bacillus sp. SCS-151]|uniref:Gfo/Idh/MocA family protein n=1 Tax=Nanhaiella sioensis TaxID=3115293 RepID=UPI00397B554A
MTVLSEKIKVGLIGMGAIGERVLRQFQQHNEIDIAALCDRNADSLNKFKDELPNVSLYLDHLDMLKDESIQLIYVGVPPKFHHKIAIDVIRNGRHLLCEKPLANSTEEALEMVEEAEKANIVHAMNFPMVYSQEFQVFKNKIMNGELGSVKKIELNLHFTEWPRKWQQNEWISSREQGGFIREVAPHFIQIIHDVFGEMSIVRSSVEYPENEDLCETSFISSMKLSGGIPVLFNGLAGIGQKEHLSLKVFGDQGTLEIENWGILSETRADDNGSIIPVDSVDKENVVDELVKAIKGDSAKLVSFKEGYAVQKVLDEILLAK